MKCSTGIVETTFPHIPKYFDVLNKLFTLIYDAMFVNRVAFLPDLFIDIRKFSAEHLKSRIDPIQSSSLKKSYYLYARGGFIVKILLVD